MSTRTRNPDRCLRTVAAAKAPPSDSLETALFDVLKNGTTSNDLVAYAYEVYGKETEREILQAWLIAGATDAQLFEHLSIPVDVTRVYRVLFFDVDVFRDRLDMLSWVSEYAKELGGTAYGARLLQTAVTRGVDTLRWLFGAGAGELDPQQVLQQAMSDAYYRGKSNRDYALSSKETAMAHTFMNTAVKIASQLDKKKAPDANALLIKLRYRDMTESVETLPEKQNLLH